MAEAGVLGKAVDDLASRLFVTLETIKILRDEHGNGVTTPNETKLEDFCDFVLSRLLRNSANNVAMRRAALSRCRDLTVEATSAIRETTSFIRALNRDIELQQDDDETRETLSDYASHVHNLTEHLSNLIEKYPKAAEGIGSDFANWPFLIFKADERKLPAHLVAQMRRIELGVTCAVNPSPRKNWSALQKYLFEIFWERQDVERMANWKEWREGDDSRKLKFIQDHLSDYMIDVLREKERSRIKAEAVLFFSSLELPPPQRANKGASKQRQQKARETRKEWAEKFLIPLVHLRHPGVKQLKDEPAFAVAVKFAKVDDEKGILASLVEQTTRALETMAREASA